MTNGPLEEFRVELRKAPPRLVFADAADLKVHAAAEILVAEKLAQPVLVEPPDDMDVADGVQVLSVDDPTWSQRCAAEYEAICLERGVAAVPAESAVRDPLLFAALYARLGQADAGLAGSLSTSAAVVRAGILGLRPAQRDGLVCGCFVMCGGPELHLYADCSVVPDPTSAQLAEIAIAAADCRHRITGEESKVAMLSFSTNGSAKHPSVTKIVEAVDRVRALREDLVVEGEMQFDVAVVPEVAARKLPGSKVSGRANVFVFPDLGAGNIAYKIAERFGGLQAIGSLILGLSRPWVDLSRGCSTRDIVDTAVVLGHLARQRSFA